MSAPVLAVEDFSLAIGQRREEPLELLTQCSLRVQPGEILGLAGESGSGKSLLARACLGLLPGGAQTAGRIALNGQDVLGRTPAQLRALRGREVAMIFQNPMRALNPFYRIGEQLGAVLKHRVGVRSQAERQARARQALEQVRLRDPDGTLARYPHQVSGGQLQRVMIAMAMLCEPRLLVADEPTTALDVTVQAEVLDLLAGIVRDTGTAMLLISHDLAVLRGLCDRLSILYAGSLVEAGPTAAVAQQPVHPLSLIHI